MFTISVSLLFLHSFLTLSSTSLSTSKEKLQLTGSIFVSICSIDSSRTLLGSSLASPLRNTCEIFPFVVCQVETRIVYKVGRIYEHEVHVAVRQVLDVGDQVRNVRHRRLECYYLLL